MEIIAYSRSGRPVGKVTVIDRSRPGQRCVSYVNYSTTKGAR